MQTPEQVVRQWVEYFNQADIDGLCSLYHRDAINHQVVTHPLVGREAIRELFHVEFARAKMVCDIEMLHEAGEWAILEWTDPIGLRGCGFFHVKNGLIVFQRGYFDQQTFFELQKIQQPEESYLK